MISFKGRAPVASALFWRPAKSLLPLIPILLDPSPVQRTFGWSHPSAEETISADSFCSPVQSSRNRFTNHILDTFNWDFFNSLQKLKLHVFDFWNSVRNEKTNMDPYWVWHIHLSIWIFWQFTLIYPISLTIVRGEHYLWCMSEDH